MNSYKTYIYLALLTLLGCKGNDGNDVRCNGFTVEVFADKSEKLEIDVFSAAVNFELLENSISEVEQFAKDYVDCEEKEYRRMIDEFNEY